MLKQKTLFLVWIIVCLTSGTVSYSQQHNPVYANISEVVKAYYEYLPQGYPANGVRYPLIVFCHGAGERGPGTPASLPLVLRNGIPKLINDGVFPTSFTVDGQTFRFIIVSPQFGGNNFPSVNDVNNMINYAINKYPIDINRIYLTGLSMGGGVSWYFPGYNTYFSSRLAAIVPVCGATEVSQNDANNIAATNLPVWATHNSGDQTVLVSVTNNMVDLINNRTTPPNPLAKKTIFNANGHDAWTQTYNPSFRENGLNIYEWMLKYKRNFVVLPVSGLSFSAQQVSNARRIELKWSTQAETNIAGFNIMRSTDGSNFTPIAFVPAMGNNGGGRSYSYIDENPAQGKDFYKLEIKELNGSVNYSDIRMVNLDALEDISIFPNPVKNNLQIQTTGVLKNAGLQIFNSNGQQVLNNRINGTGNIVIPVAALAPGIYTLSIIEKEQIRHLKFLKQ